MRIGKEIKRIRNLDLPQPVKLPERPILMPNWPVKVPDGEPAGVPEKGGDHGGKH